MTIFFLARWRCAILLRWPKRCWVNLPQSGGCPARWIGIDKSALEEIIPSAKSSGCGVIPMFLLRFFVAVGPLLLIGCAPARRHIGMSLLADTPSRHRPRAFLQPRSTLSNITMQLFSFAAALPPLDSAANWHSNPVAHRVRFLPDGKSLIYMQGLLASQDFWLLDLASMKPRPLTRLQNRAPMRTFDVTSDGKQIVFDRLRENSRVVMIDLPKE